MEPVHVDVDAREEPLHGLVEAVPQQPDGAHLQVLGHLAQDDLHLLLHRLHRGPRLHGDLHQNGEGLSLYSCGMLRRCTGHIDVAVNTPRGDSSLMFLNVFI